MAKPRVFVSSTYYDLKYIRASLDIFIESLGYESVLSEKGDIAYSFERTLDQSCYREAENTDIFVLIIGGRYGSATSDDGKKLDNSFYSRYESITKKEYETAVAKDIPIYILIEKSVYAEYETYLVNKNNDKVNYAHVQSINVFSFIEYILIQPRNNPIKTFERFEEIETWLRDQWAGMLKEMLRLKSQQVQITGIAGQVSELKAVNETLKTYLEALMNGITKQKSSELIKSEEKKLDELRQFERIKSNHWIKYAVERCRISFDQSLSAVISCNSFDEYFLALGKIVNDNAIISRLTETMKLSPQAKFDFNEIRKAYNLELLEFASDEEKGIEKIQLHDMRNIKTEIKKSKKRKVG